MAVTYIRGTSFLRSRKQVFGTSGSMIFVTHTLSLLIQAGTSLAYVRDQLGHSSIQVTADLYGHLVPNANVGWVDGLNSVERVEQSAAPAQQETEDENADSFEVIENAGGPGVSRTRDLRFRKPLLYPSELRGHLQKTERLRCVQ
jgi:hypothetical protein